MPIGSRNEVVTVVGCGVAGGGEVAALRSADGY